VGLHGQNSSDAAECRIVPLSAHAPFPSQPASGGDGRQSLLARRLAGYDIEALDAQQACVYETVVARTTEVGDSWIRTAGPSLAR